MWEYFTLKRACASKILADASQEKQEYKVKWQQESPFKEVMEHDKRILDTDCNAQIVRRPYNAKKSGNWETFKEDFR